MTRPGRHSTTPLSARSSYDNKNRAHGSRVMELPEVADNSPRVASEKQHGTESENTCNFPIIDTFGRCLWKAIAPEASHQGTPKRVCTIDGSPHPLPVIYTYGASARPIIPVVRIYITYSTQNRSGVSGNVFITKMCTG